MQQGLGCAVGSLACRARPASAPLPALWAAASMPQLLACLPRFAAFPSSCTGGPFCATPKAILEHMGGEGATAASLTLANVKSHLQASRGKQGGRSGSQLAHC